jgi:hypothetical protein
MTMSVCNIHGYDCNIHDYECQLCRSHAVSKNTCAGIFQVVIQVEAVHSKLRHLGIKCNLLQWFKVTRNKVRHLHFKGPFPPHRMSHKFCHIGNIIFLYFL